MYDVETLHSISALDASVLKALRRVPARERPFVTAIRSRRIASLVPSLAATAGQPSTPLYRTLPLFVLLII